MPSNLAAINQATLIVTAIMENHVVTEKEAKLFLQNKYYPNIHIQRQTGLEENVYNLKFVEQENNNESMYMRISRILYESSWQQVCNLIWQIMLRHSALLRHLVQLFESASERLTQSYCKLNPSYLRQTPESLAHCSETRNWQNALIRYVAWHPNSKEFALLSGNDAVLLYSLTSDPGSLTNRHKFVLIDEDVQVQISCAAFRPFTDLELAVGCANGVCLWSKIGHRRLRSLIHPRGEYCLLSTRTHKFITAVQWNKIGTLLATAAIGDSCVVVWEPDRLKKSVLHSFSGSCTLLKWSPCNRWLFASRNDQCNNVWQTEEVQWQRSTLALRGTVQTADWLSTGGRLLYVLKGSTQLRCISCETQPQFLRCVDFDYEDYFLADLSVSRLSGHLSGGTPQKIVIDAQGKFLAVLYLELSYVGVCMLSTFPEKVCLSELYAIASRDPNEHPTFICFQSKTKACDAHACVLTIAWSSGRVQFEPCNILGDVPQHTSLQFLQPDKCMRRNINHGKKIN